MLPPTPSHFRECAKRDERPTNRLATPQTRSLSFQGKQEKNSLKLTEQCRYLYENKGQLLKTRGRSRNVYENKSTYPLKDGM
jgi:hypothetical protein